MLEGYSLPLVDQLIAVDRRCDDRGVRGLHVHRALPALMATIPFVVFGLFRYLLLVHRDDLGEEPENVLLSDRPLVARGRRSGRSPRP